MTAPSLMERTHLDMFALETLPRSRFKEARKKLRHELWTPWKEEWAASGARRRVFYLFIAAYFTGPFLLFALPVVCLTVAVGRRAIKAWQVSRARQRFNRQLDRELATRPRYGRFAPRPLRTLGGLSGPGRGGLGPGPSGPSGPSGPPGPGHGPTGGRGPAPVTLAMPIAAPVLALAPSASAGGHSHETRTGEDDVTIIDLDPATGEYDFGATSPEDAALPDPADLSGQVLSEAQRTWVDATKVALIESFSVSSTASDGAGATSKDSSRSPVRDPRYVAPEEHYALARRVRRAMLRATPKNERSALRSELAQVSDHDIVKHALGELMRGSAPATPRTTPSAADRGLAR